MTEDQEPSADAPVIAAHGRTAGLGIVFLTIFLDLIGFGIVLPLLPDFARHPHNASEWQVGLLMATYSLMQFFFSPVWGRLSDRIGRRPVLLISISGSAASYLLFAFAPSLTMLFVSRAFAGIMAANIATAQAYVADVTRPEDRAKGMGLVGAAFGLGFVIGPAIGGVVSGTANPQVAVGLTAAGFSLFDLILASFLLKESLAPENRNQAVAAEGTRLQRMMNALSHPTIGPPIVVFFISTVAWSQLEPTLTLLARNFFGMSRPQIGYTFAYLGLLVALIQGGYAGRAAKKVGEPRMILVGTILLAVALALVPFARGTGMLYGVLSLLALGQALNTPALQSMISRSTAAAEQGSVLGVSQGFSSLARVIGPATGGYLFGRNPAYPFWFGAVLMVLAFLLAGRVARSVQG